jgi:negative regulator of sigma-B (phosphoserine phosphatase)
MSPQPAGTSVVEWGWAGQALDERSGDLHVVVGFPGGCLVALLDGLGHGPEAAAASMTAAPLLEGHAGESVLSLVQRCHDGLRKTRGVVMSLASFRASDSSMTWIGVGNVDGVLLRARSLPGRSDEAIVVRSGVVGYQLPPLRAQTLLVSPGDTLIMVTDGIRSGFTAAIIKGRPAQETADSILSRFVKGTDDAHVVVARYLGAGP